MSGFNGVSVPKASGIFCRWTGSTVVTQEPMLAGKQGTRPRNKWACPAAEGSSNKLREQTKKIRGETRTLKESTKGGEERNQRLPPVAPNSTRLFVWLWPLPRRRRQKKGPLTKFSNEADAEEYTKSRQSFSELENEESKKSSKASKTNKLQVNNEFSLKLALPRRNILSNVQTDVLKASRLLQY
jgi:hypothetical protein